MPALMSLVVDLVVGNRNDLKQTHLFISWNEEEFTS